MNRFATPGAPPRFGQPSYATAFATPSLDANDAYVDASELAVDEISPLRKAAILLVSLDQPLASQLLVSLDRDAVESVTLEIARLEHVSPTEQAAVLAEFYNLGLRRLQFGFDDIDKLSAIDIQSAYHREDAATWALALASASKTLRDHVLNTLEDTDREILRRRIESLGPFRVADAESAQAELTELIRRLNDLGKLELPGSTKRS